MPKIWQAKTVQEAVQLAQELRAAGTYSWFRGQARDWPPHSGLTRLRLNEDEAGMARARERLKLFASWLQVTPALSHFLDERPQHSIFAIAQHYGIPTDYIDFTTDPVVAGFFAADVPTPPEGGQSCIYCLDVADLMEEYRGLVEAGARPPGEIEPIEIDVHNLWRLEAQRGVFLYSTYGWDMDYPLDRIVFPYTGYPSYPPRDYIYPSDKSALEHLLEQYFDNERKHFANAEIRERIRESRRNGVDAVEMRMVRPPGGLVAEYFSSPAEIVPLDSWARAAHPDWKGYPTEAFDAITRRVERIAVAGTDPRALREAVAYGVSQALGRTPGLRGQLVEWAVDGPPDAPLEALKAGLRAAWNGMRRRPFTDAQVARAMSEVAGSIAAGLEKAPTHGESVRRFAAVRGESLRVEFVYADLASSQAVVTLDALRRAMRGDVEALLKPEHRGKLASDTFILQAIQDPRLLFDFDRFADLFATDIIPSQIALGRDPVLYDPSATAFFGLP